MKVGSACRGPAYGEAIPVVNHSTQPTASRCAPQSREAPRGGAAAFAESGLDAQVEDIARRAGVGVGTLYRHFPTKEALVDALARAHFERLADIVEAPDATATRGRSSRRRSGAAPTRSPGRRALRDHRRPSGRGRLGRRGPDRLEAATAKLIAGARARGAIREDATVLDVRTMMCGFGHVAAAQRAGARLDWQRYLTIALDGLRAR